MRRTLITCLLAFAALPVAAHAQSYAIDKGSLSLGGTGGFSTSKASSGNTEGDRVTTIQVSPSFLYFISPGLGVGASAALGRESSDGYTTVNLGIGPRATYYFGRGERNVYPYLGATVGVHHGNTDSDNGDSSSNTLRLEGNGGLLVMLSRAVGMNVELSFETTNASREMTTATGATVELPEVDSNRFGLAVGFTAFIF